MPGSMEPDLQLEDADSPRGSIPDLSESPSPTSPRKMKKIYLARKVPPQPEVKVNEFSEEVDDDFDVEALKAQHFYQKEAATPDLTAAKKVLTQ